MVKLRTQKVFGFILVVASAYATPSLAQQSNCAPTYPNATTYGIACSTPISGQAVINREGYFYSPDGRFRLKLQESDGNLVLYQGSKALWATNEFVHPPEIVERALFTADGDLQVYFYNRSTNVNRMVWHSGTGGHSGAKFSVQNDGNAVIYDASGSAIWATGTCCR